MLEGSKISVPRAAKNGLGTDFDIVDTKNILFICSGSFAGIDEIVERRLNKKGSLGFGSVARLKATEINTYLLVEEADILEFGIIPEMLGRIPIHTTTLPLTNEEMVQILTEPKNANCPADAGAVRDGWHRASI
jgi:ATP-dependent Clp protease ATP-binding subunit ClpX